MMKDYLENSEAGRLKGLVMDNPEEYMRRFSERAEKLKKKWREALIVELDIQVDEYGDRIEATIGGRQ